jgi:hypothetical protein
MMADEQGNPTLPELLKALGAKTSDLMGMKPEDRDQLKRWLREENEAVAAEKK